MKNITGRAKKGILFLFVLIFTICLLSCGKKKVKTENEIKTDLEPYLKETFVLGEDLLLDNFQIIERQTDTSGKTDTVLVSYEVSTDFVKATGGTLIMSYYLYDDGWALADMQYEDNNIQFTALASSITTEQVEDRLLSEGYENVSFLSRSESPELAEEDIFYYQYQQSTGSIVNTYEIALRYVFTDYYWSFDDIYISLTNSSMDESEILGVWRYEDSTCKLYVNAVAINLNNMTIDLECSFENYSKNMWTSSESDDIQTFRLGYCDDNINLYVALSDGEEDFGSLYFSPIETDKWNGSDMGKGFIFGGGYYFGTRWLTRE